MRKHYKVIITIALLAGCSKPSPTLQNFDAEKWKADKNGCIGDRSQFQNNLDAQLNSLLGYTELELV